MRFVNERLGVYFFHRTVPQRLRGHDDGATKHTTKREYPNPLVCMQCIVFGGANRTKHTTLTGTVSPRALVAAAFVPNYSATNIQLIYGIFQQQILRLLRLWHSGSCGEECIAMIRAGK